LLFFSFFIFFFQFRFNVVLSFVSDQGDGKSGHRKSLQV